LSRNRSSKYIVVTDAELTRYLRALWPEVARRVPALAGAKAKWSGEEVVVTGARVKSDVNRVEETVEAILKELGLGEVTVWIRS